MSTSLFDVCCWPCKPELMSIFSSIFYDALMCQLMSISSLRCLQMGFPLLMQTLPSMSAGPCYAIPLREATTPRLALSPSLDLGGGGKGLGF